MKDQNDMKMDKLEDSMLKLTESINSLVLEMRERDIEDRYLREKISRMEQTQESTLREFAPVWERSKKKQDDRESFFNNMRSTGAKLAMVFIVVVVAAGLGINAGDWFKI